MKGDYWNLSLSTQISMKFLLEGSISHNLYYFQENGRDSDWNLEIISRKDQL